MSTCIWRGLNQPRAVRDRHLEDCEGDCRGCQPCTADHCRGCGLSHVSAASEVCPGCLYDLREDLDEIGAMCCAIPGEAMVKGVESEAAVLAGPVADPEAFEHRVLSAASGRLDASWLAWLETADDIKHPLWVLGRAEMIMREVLGFEPSSERASAAGALRFVVTWLASASRCEDLDWEELRQEVSECRRYLERVLHDGEQVVTGAPCMSCETRLRRVWRGMALPWQHRDGSSPRAAEDGWACPRCRTWRTEQQYRLAVAHLYREGAEWLSDRDIEVRFGVRAGTVREWARREHVRKRQHGGRTVYEVASVEQYAKARGLIA